MRKRGILPLCVGLALLAVFLLAAIAPGVLTPYSPKELVARWLPSGGVHLLGTNAMGYDIFTELVYGARQTLLAGGLSSILALALGALVAAVYMYKNTYTQSMAVTLALALGNGWYLQRLTGGMALELENAQTLAEEGDLDGARELTGQVYDRWQSRQTYLCVVARHGDTGEIQTGFQEVLQLLRWPDELPEFFFGLGLCCIGLLGLVCTLRCAAEKKNKHSVG